MNKEVMYKNLIDFKEVMEKHQIPFVLIFGALLGLVRDKDLLEWDNDVDVACFREDKWKTNGLIEDMVKKGFELQPNTPEHDTNFIRDGEKIEIWWFDKVNDKWVYDFNIQYEDYYFDSLDDLEFLSDLWLIPYDVEDFLKKTYGDDWRIPNRHKGYILRGEVK